MCADFERKIELTREVTLKYLTITFCITKFWYFSCLPDIRSVKISCRNWIENMYKIIHYQFCITNTFDKNAVTRQIHKIKWWFYSIKHACPYLFTYLFFTIKKKLLIGYFLQARNVLAPLEALPYGPRITKLLHF